MKKTTKNILAVLLVLTMAIMAGCGANSENGKDKSQPGAGGEQSAKKLEGKLVILHAGSLAVPFDKMEKEFEKMYPQVDIQREAAGSRDCAKKITDLGIKADILASADYTVIDQLLIPKYADWNALFANNELVIMYSDHSKFKNEIKTDNWQEVLLRDGVNYGHSDPNADPCGYRALMVWQLAEKYYKQPGLYKKLVDQCPPRNIRPKETDLLALVESGALDYLFIYRSVAEQHHMPYVKMPAEVNLGDINQADLYKQAKVDTTGKKPGEVITQIGTPIVYGVTMVKDAPNKEVALEFMKYLLSKDKGLKVMEESGQPVPETIKVEGEEKLPPELKAVIGK
ncbi:MAG: molybdenum ABC transporter substrate-binding protein [Peptococcaceae bacterium BRH_c4b]|nr:MAG: molybdenum ABC transporter substrate-binding protein [Peptococcaceae bacterium BRH_c4b]